jgi:hypothetical protein
MSVRLSCPSCNTAFALPAPPADRRATCPRCGDVFPVRGELAEQADGEAESEPAAPAPGTKHDTRNTKWVAALALGLLGVGVGLGVYYRLGGFGSKAEPRPEPPGAATAPAQLAALGYLPADCNVLFAVQPGPVLAYAQRTGQDPRELLTRSGVPVQVLGALDQLGLELTQIDHIAGGTSVGDVAFELRITLVLVLRAPPADEGDFLNRMKARRTGGNKPRHEVELAKLPLTLARVSETVWVFGMTDKDLEAVDRGGFGPGATQFRGSETRDGAEKLVGLREMVASIPPDAAVWAAADDERDWTQKPAVRLLAKSPEAKKWLPAVSSGRGGLVALSFGNRPRIQLLVLTADAATAERVRAYFAARAAEVESATSGGSGYYARYDAPFDPATGWTTLQRFLADATR